MFFLAFIYLPTCLSGVSFNEKYGGNSNRDPNRETSENNQLYRQTEQNTDCRPFFSQETYIYAAVEPSYQINSRMTIPLISVSGRHRSEMASAS